MRRADDRANNILLAQEAEELKYFIKTVHVRKAGNTKAYKSDPAFKRHVDLRKLWMSFLKETYSKHLDPRIPKDTSKHCVSCA